MITRLVMCMALCGLPGVMHAGQACGTEPVRAEELRKGLRLASETRIVLEATGAAVVLVGRIGRDMSRYGLRYSHMGLALRDHPKGRWTIVHQLNHCGSDRSALFDEGLGNFFLDDLFAFESVVVAPSQTVQERLLRALDTPLATDLHEPRYSIIAYPSATSYQNSNQWVLEVLAAALASEGAVVNRAAAQTWLTGRGYTPSRIYVAPMERVGAGLFAANVRFDDHPEEARRSGHYHVVSADSVLAFLGRLDPRLRRRVVALD